MDINKMDKEDVEKFTEVVVATMIKVRVEELGYSFNNLPPVINDEILEWLLEIHKTVKGEN